MRRKMQQQGIDMEPIDAVKVIIEGPEKSLVIENPEVVLMKQMGQEIYQVIGTANEFSSEEISVTQSDESEEVELLDDSGPQPTITENDIMLVAAQANVDKSEAEATLIECDGDIAKAILLLKNRP
ncbi:MAG: nascent polypeptide-associated complex protein [Candidatus Hermodarchaeota archaeon]